MKSVSSEFIDALREDAIHTKIKVEAEFGNNRFNDDQICKASSTKLITRLPGSENPYAVFWQSDDVFNNINRNVMRYGVADRGAKAVSQNSDNPAYRAVSMGSADLLNVELERGWWSLFKSDSAALGGWTTTGFDDSSWTNAIDGGSYLGGDVQPTGTYTDFGFADNPTGYIYNMDFYINVEVENNPNTDSYFWSQQFRFRGPGADGGYMGIQSDSNGKRAIFSIWSALNAEGPEVARPFSGEGTGYQTSITYNWKANTRYRIRLWVLEGESGNVWWGAWIMNMSTREEHFIGKILVPGIWGWISPGPHTCFTERYGGVPLYSILDIGYVNATMVSSLNNNQIAHNYHLNHLATPQHAPNSKICDTNFKDFITGIFGSSANPVRHIIGFNVHNPPSNLYDNNCIVAVGTQTPWIGYPINWPDVGANWIWKTAGNIPVKKGQVWFRKIVNVGSDTLCKIYITADNAFQCWVNENFIFQGGDTWTVPQDIQNELPAQDLGIASRSIEPYGWQTSFSAPITLTSGDNIIAIKAVNLSSPGGDNPAGLLVSLIRDSDGVVLARSDTSWKCIDYKKSNSQISLTAHAVAGGGDLEGTYYYVVSSTDSGHEYFSNEVSVDVELPNDSVELDWTIPGGGKNFRVYRGNTSGGEDIYYDVVEYNGADISVYGKPTTFGSLTDSTINDHTLQIMPDTDYQLIAGGAYYFSELLPDGKIAIACEQQSNNPLQSTARFSQMIFFDPLDGLYDEEFIFTPQGTSPSDPSTGDIIGATDCSDLQLVTRHGETQLAVSLSAIYFNWDISAEHLYPGLVFFHNIGTNWEYDFVDDTYTLEQIALSNPTAADDIYIEHAGLNGNYYENGVFSEMALLPKSQYLVIGHYLAPSTATRNSGAISVINPEDGTLVATYKIPTMTLGGTTLEVSPREFETDPTSVLGDERFTIIHDAYPYPPTPHAIQEFSFDYNTSTIIPKSIPIVPLQDDLVTLGGDQGAPECGTHKYDSNGNLFVTCNTVHSLLPGNPMAVYTKSTITGERKYVIDAPASLGYTNTYGKQVEADYYVAAPGDYSQAAFSFDVDSTNRKILPVGLNGVLTEVNFLSALTNKYNNTNLMSSYQQTLLTANSLSSNDSIFSTDTSGYAPFFGTALSTGSVTVPAGWHAMQMTAAGNNAIEADLISKIFINPLERLSINAWFLAASTSHNAYATVNFYDNSDNLILQAAATGTTSVSSQWTESAVTFIAPPGSAYCRVVLHVNTTTTGQTHYVTNVSVFRHFPYEPIAGEVFRTQLETFTGPTVMKLRSLFNSAVAATTRIQIIPGKQYMAFAEFQASVSARQTEIRLSFFDINNNLLKFIWPTHSAIDNESEWTRVFTTADAPDGAFSMEVQVYFSSTTIGEVHYIRNINAVALPFTRQKIFDIGLGTLRATHGSMQIRKAAIDKVNHRVWIPGGKLMPSYVVQPPEDFPQFLWRVNLVNNSITNKSIDKDFNGENSGSPMFGGTFLKPEFVEASFNARIINQINLFTTEGYPNMSNVTVEYFNINLNQWIIVADNYALSEDIYEYFFPLDTSAHCNSLRAFINGTFQENDYARLSEINGVYVLDVSDDVVSATINQAREEYVNNVPVGMVRANTLDLVLQNIDQRYSPGKGI